LIVLIKSFHSTLNYFPSFAKILKSSIHPSPLELSQNYFSIGIKSKSFYFVEGASIHRPPMFSGVNYQFWKVRMKNFVESIDHGIWNAIVNCPYVLMTVVNGVHVEKSYDELSDAENKKMQYDRVAKNIIISALNLDEFFRVSQCNSIK